MLEVQECSLLQAEKLSSSGARRFLRIVLRVTVFSSLLFLRATRAQDDTTSTDTAMLDKRSLTQEDSVEEYWGVEPYNLPMFDNSTAKNVSTQLGQTAFLHCIVDNLGDKTVSWIRRKDFHVLTVGTDTYISDDRFQTVRTSNGNDWVLQIKFTQLKDQGIYECQVSTDPKISFFVNLSVLVAEAFIKGGPKIIVKRGSSIELTCVISNSPEPPIFVFWYHDNRMINYDSKRGDISVQKAAAKTIISKLYIKDIGEAESGNYTCGPSNAGPTSVSVVISNGEKPAAMQHDGNSSPLNGVQTRTSLLWHFALFRFLINYVTR